MTSLCIVSTFTLITWSTTEYFYTLLLLLLVSSFHCWMSLGCSSPARPAGGVAQHCPGGRDVTRALAAVWARASPELLRSRASRTGADGGDTRTDMDVFLTAAGGFHRVSQVNLRFTHLTSVLWSISSSHFCPPCPLKLTLQAPGRTSWSFICISTQTCMYVCRAAEGTNRRGSAG